MRQTSRRLKRLSGAGETRRRPTARLAQPPTKAKVPAAFARLSLQTATPRSELKATLPAKRSRRGTARRIVRWSLAVAMLLVIGYAGWVGVSFYALQQRIYRPLPPTPTAVVSQKPTALAGQAGSAGLPTSTPDLTSALPKGRVNILVLGTDKRPEDTGSYARSDTLILVSVDTVAREAHLMSIPRDLIMTIPGYGKNKVNSAYLFGEYYQEPGGGQALAVRTISQFFSVPVDYYVTINFQGFQKVVDAVGGININVPYAMDDYNYPTDQQGNLFGETYVHFDAGWQYMDGARALIYARTRHADNDFMRSKRQLQVIMAVRQKAMSLNLLPALPSLLDSLGGMVETNIPFDRQMAFAQLAYNIEPSSITTATIDSNIIIPATLPDGSEGFTLNWKLAQPMLDSFFGRVPVSSNLSGSSPNSPVESSGSGSLPQPGTPTVAGQQPQEQEGPTPVSTVAGSP